MSTASHVLTIDRLPDRHPKRCSSCRHWKARDEFSLTRSTKDGRHNQCKQCRRIAEYQRYHEGGGKALHTAYQAREDVKERRQRYNEANKEALVARRRRYKQTVRGRLFDGRSKARSRLRKATTDEARARIAAVVAMFDREIARLDSGRELRIEPPEPTNAFRGVYETRRGTYEGMVTVPGQGQVRCGSFRTEEEARVAVNEAAFRLLGVRDYAVAKTRKARQSA